MPVQSAVAIAFVAAFALIGCVALWEWPRRFVDTVLERLDDFVARPRRRRLKDAPTAALLLSPALVILATFGIFPLFFAMYMSVYEWKGIRAVFVGLGNFQEALGRSDFWDAFLVTLYYAVGTIPVSMAVSFLIATVLFRIVRARGFFRTVFFLPYVTSAVAAATVWRAILNPRAGLVNTLLGWCGLQPDTWPTWLLEPKGVLHLLSGGSIGENVGPSLALCCVIFFDIWHSSGFMIVVFLAGLTAIPRELEEAAIVDGASWFQTTRKLTLPLLSPTIFFLLVVNVIKAFQSFNSFYALTGGRGPLDTTQNLTVYIYSNFYEYHRLGYGAAVATLLAVAIVALTLIQWRYVGRRVHYE